MARYRQERPAAPSDPENPAQPAAAVPEQQIAAVPAQPAAAVPEQQVAAAVLEQKAAAAAVLEQKAAEAAVLEQKAAAAAVLEQKAAAAAVLAQHQAAMAAALAQHQAAMAAVPSQHQAAVAAVPAQQRDLAPNVNVPALQKKSTAAQDKEDIQAFIQETARMLQQIHALNSKKRTDSENSLYENPGTMTPLEEVKTGWEYHPFPRQPSIRSKQLPPRPPTPERSSSPRKRAKASRQLSTTGERDLSAAFMNKYKVWPDYDE